MAFVPIVASIEMLGSANYRAHPQMAKAFAAMGRVNCGRDSLLEMARPKSARTEWESGGNSLPTDIAPSLFPKSREHQRGFGKFKAKLLSSNSLRFA